MESYLVNSVTMLCVLLHSLGCLAIAEIEYDRVTSQPSGDKDLTVTPGSISKRHPYLYYATIIFAALILGTAVLIVFRACIQNCQKSCPHRLCNNSQSQMPRCRSLGNTDSILINGRLIPADRPPDYASICKSAPNMKSSPIECFQSLKIPYDSPPPSYQSII
ncbi:hypothetical protein X975_05424, partial [Stegodyphus mimosarum]